MPANTHRNIAVSKGRYNGWKGHRHGTDQSGCEPSFDIKGFAYENDRNADIQNTQYAVELRQLVAAADP